MSIWLQWVYFLTPKSLPPMFKSSVTTLPMWLTPASCLSFISSRTCWCWYSPLPRVCLVYHLLVLKLTSVSCLSFISSLTCWCWYSPLPRVWVLSHQCLLVLILTSASCLSFISSMTCWCVVRSCWYSCCRNVCSYRSLFSSVWSCSICKRNTSLDFRTVNQLIWWNVWLLGQFFVCLKLGFV